MFNLKTTEQHKKYWADRKIDWEESYLKGVDPVTNRPMWDHPHRQMLVWALQSFPWLSLWEVGCGAGANLVKIAKSFEKTQLGGSDVNADAIGVASKYLPNSRFNVESVEDMLLSDNSADVILSDATLIYIDPSRIKKAIKEMIRVARNNIVLCEFHGKSWWDRLWLRVKTGYNAYNYQTLLEEEGCYDIQIVKIPTEFWPGFPWDKWGYIILAKVPKK